MSLQSLLSERKLPVIPEREKILEILQENEFGFQPNVDYSVSVSEPKIIDKRMVSGTVELSTVTMTVSTVYGSHSFDVLREIHNDGKKHPFFVFLNFHPGLASFYYPMEEIADGDFDVFSVCYKDVTSDDGDFSNGLAGILLPNGQENDNTCGKIGLWSFAAMRILDYALTIPSVDPNNAAVIGHSRLGKTALLTGMLDTRFKYVISNDSGCFGAALHRGNSGQGKDLTVRANRGELITDITNMFPYWFCKNAQKYRETNIPDVFDQHFLLASIAPRYVYVASASEDKWADPTSEFLSAAAASESYEKLGLVGLVHSDAIPEGGEYFHKGRIGYHKRPGMHFLSRYDWNRYMDYIKLHLND